MTQLDRSLSSKLELARGDTLRLRRPLGGTVGRSLLLLFLLVTVAELVSRLDDVRYRFVPRIGSTHRQFETQLARLERLDEQQGPIDCIFLGNSMVWLNVNPPLFSQGYELETGKPLLCFNFGVATMPTSAAAALAEILIADYRPSLLIYGTSARDLAIPISAQDARVILDTPWVSQKSGDGSIKGWLAVNSQLYGRLYDYGRLLNFDFTVIRTDYASPPHQKYGFDPKVDAAQAINIEASRKDAARWLFDYQIHPENVRALEEIANHNGRGVQVLLVDMPVRQDYFDGFKYREQDFRRYLDLTENVASESGIPFWPSTDMHVIAEDGWWNSNHLNLVGADKFSYWLGREVGRSAPEFDARR